MDVTLFYMYKAFGGGTTSYTAHLYEALKQAGHTPRIVRVRDKEQKNPRPFAGYAGVELHNISVATGLKLARTTPSLMTAPCNQKYLQFEPTIIKRLMKAGMQVMVHSWNELEIYDDLGIRNTMRPPLIVRPHLASYFKQGAKFMYHPYVRHYTDNVGNEKTKNAVSIARMTFVKHPEIIIAANEMLPAKKRVVIRGAENRMLTHFKIGKLFPAYEHKPSGFQQAWGAGALECAAYNFAVDMTYLAGDGGGSQYAFMEAWDAGTVNIVHNKWLEYKGEMKVGFNCLAVADHAELAAILDGTERYHHIIFNGYRQLKSSHDPVPVARDVMRELERG